MACSSVAPAGQQICVPTYLPTSISSVLCPPAAKKRRCGVQGADRQTDGCGRKMSKMFLTTGVLHIKCLLSSLACSLALFFVLFFYRNAWSVARGPRAKYHSSVPLPSTCVSVRVCTCAVLSSFDAWSVSLNESFSNFCVLAAKHRFGTMLSSRRHPPRRFPVSTCAPDVYVGMVIF